MYEGENWREKHSEEELQRVKNKGIWPDNYTNKSRYHSFTSPIIRELDFNSLTQILDIGSSKGIALNSMIKGIEEYEPQFDFEATCLDVKKSNLRTAKESYGFETVKGTAWNMPFKSNSQDLIISKFSISQLEKEHQEQSLREISRILDPEGYAALHIKRVEDLPITISGEYFFSADQYQTLEENSDNFEENPYAKGLGEEWLSEARLFTPHWKL